MQSIVQLRIKVALPWILAMPLAATSIATPVYAADWSTTELQFQYGNLDVPQFAGGGDDGTVIFTFQHASGYSWGDFFMFSDVLNGANGNNNHFNDWDIYTEAYINFSSSKLLKAKYGDGVLRDIGLIGGINYDADAEVLKLLPGVRFAWNIPGFNFLNTDFMAYLDASEGVDGGPFNAPKETDSWMLDVNFASKSFEIGGQSFNFEGHVEYVAPRKNEFGADVEGHLFGQPQFRWDAGKTIFKKPNKLFIGTEYQFWFNKLGEKNTDEQALQALVVWRF